MNGQDIQHRRSTLAPSTAILQTRGANQFQTLNIYGGTGGNGGGGRAGGQGGGGGAGEGPRLNYDIGAGIFTVNLVVQGHEREFSGATRNLHRQMRTRSTPYDPPSPHLALTGFTGGNHLSDLHPPSSEQAIAAFDTTPSSAPQFTPTRAASSITLPSFRLLFPDSEFPPLAGSNHARHVHADSASSSNLPPFRLALPDTQFAPPAEVNPYASDRYQSSPAFDSERQHHTRESRADFSGSASWFGAPSRPSYVEPVLGHSGTSITFNERQGEVGIHTLHRAVALEALFDSAESFPQPRCHPETRTELLDKLYAWAIDPDSAHPIQWLHGPAGAGKSAIMQTLCRRLQDAGHLGGSFFFKRGHKTCGNAQMLFATLAYQLALSRRELKRPISGSVEMDPSVLGRGMDVQLRTLILEPCQLLTDETPSVLLIDGLDECAGHHIQRQILQLIGAAVRRSLRILVASRPEPHIRETFEDQSFYGLFEFTNIEQSFEDIRTYFCQEFSRIHDEHHTMKGIPTPWPSPQIVEMLVKKSSGYFIYASTVIKFIDNQYSRPTKRLDIICNLAPQDSESPFAALDQLYFQILMEVPAHSHRVLCDILSVISNAPSGFNEDETDELLGLEPGDTSLIIRPLHSVLQASSGSFNMIRVHHASFLDFLGNGERSSIFCVGSPEHRTRLACSILEALAFTYEDRADATFRWELVNVSPGWIGYTSGVTPSANLVPLVEQVNPDFVFCLRPDEVEIKNFLYWLKKISPPPEHLIHRWEAYHFIRRYEDFENSITSKLLSNRQLRSRIQPVLAPSPGTVHALHAGMSGESKNILRRFGTLLSQSPTLVRVLQARRLLILNQMDNNIDNNNQFVPFFAIHNVLDVSWDDILQCIWSLRPFITRESHNFPVLFVLHPALCQLDGLYPEAMVSRDLGCGFLRLDKRIQNGGLPEEMWEWLVERGYARWARHVRSSPPADPELLQELDEFLSSSEIGMYSCIEDLHDVVQWLKTSPAAQPNLIHHWQTYLDKRIHQYGPEYDYDYDKLEKSWQNHLDGEVRFQGPEIDEEVIRCWETCLHKYIDTEGEQDG